MGHDNDRRAERVFPGGAGEDGSDIHGRGDGKGENAAGSDASVSSRRESEGGEDLCKGVSVHEV